MGAPRFEIMIFRCSAGSLDVRRHGRDDSGGSGAAEERGERPAQGEGEGYCGFVCDWVTVVLSKENTMSEGLL